MENRVKTFGFHILLRVVEPGTADANQDYTPITGTFKIAEDALTPSTTI